MNCLAYALRFWERQPHYRLFYNSDHVINAEADKIILVGKSPLKFLPAEDYGYDYFISSFGGLLDEHERDLLKKYFCV